MPRFTWAASIVLLLVVGSAGADESAPAPTPAPGLLLPVYAVDAPLDASGAVDAKAWGELKSAGFNAVRFPIELAGGKAAAGRLATLCAWAQSEKVGLIPVLVESAASPLGKSFEGAVKDFARDLAESLAATNATAYTRILTFQVGPELNHPARNGRQEPKKAVGAALAAAKALREAERKALEAHGLSPTPLSVSLSFDAPLLAAGAAPGFDLADAAYETAVSSLRQEVASLAASPDLDIVTVSWFAGSLSGGGAARFSAFLRGLAADAPGKQVMLVTGISGAFRPPADTDAFAKLAFANLAEHRTTGGADSPFIGVVFHRGQQGPAAAAAPAGFDEARAAWTAEALSKGVLGHWRGESTPEAIVFWATEVEARFGLLGAEGATPALAALKQVAGIMNDPATTKAVADAIATPTPEPSAPPSGSPSATPTPAPTPVDGGPTTTQPEEDSDQPNPVKEKLEAAALAALDQLLSHLTGAINNKLDGTDSPSDEPVSIAIVSAACQPAAPKVNQLVTCQVNLRNQSQKADAIGLSVALLDPGDYLLGDETMVEGVTIARSAQAMVPVKWHPQAAGAQAIQVRVYDASYAQVGAASAGQVNVKSGGSTKPGKGGKFGPIKPGFPWTGVLTAKASPMKTMSAQGGSFTFPIANTSARTLPPMTAALFVSGQRVRSLQVPSLLPGQSRQIVFDGVRVASAADHELRVTLERPGTAPFTAGTLRLEKAMLTTPPKAQVKTVPVTRPVLGGPRAKPQLTPRVTPRPTAIARTVPTPAPTPIAKPTPAGQAEVGFLGGVRVSPSVARAGQKATVAVTVANRGTRASGPVTVVFQVRDASGRVVAQGSRRLTPVTGRGQAQASWSGTLQAGGPWRVDVRIDAPGDASPGDNTASASIQAQKATRVPLRR